MVSLCEYSGPQTPAFDPCDDKMRKAGLHYVAIISGHCVLCCGPVAAFAAANEAAHCA
jgi:hypothetical protein